LHGARGLPGWLPFLEKLAQKHDVMAPDHPGYGHSDHPDWLEEIGDLALFYLEFTKALDLNDLHLVGHSMGGWIALEMAIRSTERIGTLTLISSGGLRIKGLPSPDIFAMDREEALPLFFHEAATIARALEHQPSRDEELILTRNLVTAARLAWHPRFFNPKLRKWLRRIDVPTHIVWGDSDRIQSPAYAHELNQAIAGSRVTIIPDAGHMMHIEKPDAVAAAVMSFPAS
jgi:pimeloyl-ACP methyl ester carboxylesterase